MFSISRFPRRAVVCVKRHWSRRTVGDGRAKACWWLIGCADAYPHPASASAAFHETSVGLGDGDHRDGGSEGFFCEMPAVAKLAFATAPPRAIIAVNRRARHAARGSPRCAIADRLGEPEPQMSALRDVSVTHGAQPAECLDDLVAGEACPVDRVAIWQTLCREAREEAEKEPALASYLFSTILAHRSLEDALAFVLANKLRSNVLLDSQLLELFSAQYRKDARLVRRAQADLQAVLDRDPACEKYLQPLLFFKGFQAVQAHRVAHALWKENRGPLALLLQSRISEVFHVDIHPGAVIGEGVMLDHATGVVIGETAVVGNNVSILHGVTLGGTGTRDGDRHPKIGDGVVIGAGVTILGNVAVGANSKIGAGSVVLREIPPNSVAVGIPARLVGKPSKFSEPSLDMDQVSGLSDYYYSI